MSLTPISRSSSIVSDEIGAVNILGRTASTIGATGSNIISRTSNAISKAFGGAGKVLRHGTAIGLTAVAALTFPISAAAIYTTLAGGKFIKNKAEGKGRIESASNAMTRPLGADTIAHYTDFAKVGEGIKDMTIGVGGEVIKGATETITIPLIGAKFNDTSHTTQTANPPSSTSNNDIPTPSTPSDTPTPKNENPTPIPAPTPNGGGTPPSSPETPPKTSKELEKEAKKAEEEKKKAEEKSKDQEKNEYINKIEENQKNLSKKIDDIKNSINKTKASEKAKTTIDKVKKQITDISTYKTNYINNKSDTKYTSLFTKLNTSGSTMKHTDGEYILLKELFNNTTNGISTEFSNLDKSFFSQDILISKVGNSKSNGRQIKSAIEYVAEQLENNESLDTDSITSIKALIGPTSTDEGLLGKLYSIIGKNLKDVKSSKITEKDIKDQEDNLKSALDNLKTEAQKSIKSIASKSLFGGAKINNDNKEDAISNITEKYEEVIKYSQEDSDMGQISFEKDTNKLSDLVKNLIGTIKN